MDSQFKAVKSPTLPEDARKIREDVFVHEHKFNEEFDTIDSSCTHIVLSENDKPIATCRYFKAEKENEYIAGRIAVIKEYRGKHIGQALINTMEESIKADGGIKIHLSSQMRVCGFYKRMGYKSTGNPYMDENCEHIHMEKLI